MSKRKSLQNLLTKCESCDYLSICCTGAFHKHFARLVSEDEADVYGRSYLTPHPTEPGWYLHEHYGRCPHADPKTGLCDIHFKGKPACCIMQPVSFDANGDIVLDPHCVPHLDLEQLDSHVQQVREYVEQYPIYRQRLIDMADDLLQYSGMMDTNDPLYWAWDIANRLLQGTHPHSVAVYGEFEIMQHIIQGIPVQPGVERPAMVAIDKDMPIPRLVKEGQTHDPDLIMVIGNMPAEGWFIDLPQHSRFLYISADIGNRTALSLKLLQLGWVEIPDWGDDDEYLFKNLRYVMGPCPEDAPCTGCGKTLYQLYEEEGADLPAWCPKSPLEFTYHYRYRFEPIEAQDVPKLRRPMEQFTEFPKVKCDEADVWWVNLQRSMFEHIRGKKKVWLNQGFALAVFRGTYWAWTPVTHLLGIRQHVIYPDNGGEEILANLTPNVYMQNCDLPRRVQGVSVSGKRIIMYPNRWKSFSQWKEESLHSFALERYLSQTLGWVEQEIPSDVTDPAIRAAVSYCQMSVATTIYKWRGGGYTGGICAACLPDGYWYSLFRWWKRDERQEHYNKAFESIMDEINDYYLIQASFEYQTALDQQAQKRPCVLHAQWPTARYMNTYDWAIVTPESLVDYGHLLDDPMVVHQNDPH